MKYIYLVLFLLFSIYLQAQPTTFEGMITYKISAVDDFANGELKAMFGPQTIRLEFKAARDNTREEEYLLIDLESGKVYEIRPGSKDYRVRKLSSREPVVFEASKTIAGYQTTASVLNEGGIWGMMRGLFSGHTVVYTSKDLIYPIDNKLAGNPETILILDNRIILRAQITIDKNLGMEFDDEGDETGRAQDETDLVVTIEAESVVPDCVTADKFLVPEGFTRRKRHEFYNDSVSVNFDTLLYPDSIERVEEVSIVELEEKKIIAVEKNPAKKKTPAVKKKTEAANRKEN